MLSMSELFFQISCWESSNSVVGNSQHFLATRRQPRSGLPRLRISRRLPQCLWVLIKHHTTLETETQNHSCDWRDCRRCSFYIYVGFRDWLLSWKIRPVIGS